MPVTLREEEGALVITHLPIEQMGMLVLGLPLNGQARQVFERLLSGGTVKVLEAGLEYKQFRKCAPLGVYKKFVALERELREMGICVIRNRS